MYTSQNTINSPAQTTKRLCGLREKSMRRYKNKQKRKGVQQVRAKLLLAGFDLLRNTTCAPDTHIETGTVLHRFYGKTADGSVFYAVQVKHDQKTGRKDLMSIFPIKDPN